ncbi:DHA2 family efflux MFS transporter permease subunit [Bifidobacterium xylocopae]|uniref:DHA2 family efflux MFS transporter permease subunit n=1 Tax=Bifidobacterium xylocopae TaxID=2493119 RepID=UPI00191BB7F9|nr:DHA2 family efflux MFS transporter permease subunit [Bifidobacterium xylocopae]
MRKQPPPSPSWILILTSLGFFMSMMDSMIVSTASTAIRRDFGITVASLQWALNAYNVAIAAVLLVGVALGNRFGHRTVYMAGMAVFVLGSLLSALSGGIAMLIAARVVQGVGASVLTPMSMTILASATPPERRGRALGVYSGIGGLGLIVGPALGGLIVSQLAWQWIFWINIPIGLAGIWLSRKHLPADRPSLARISMADGVLVVVASAALIVGLSDRSWRASSIATGLAGVALWGVLIVRQRGRTEPMIPLHLFHSPSFDGGNLATFLLYASMYGVVFFLPQQLQVVGGAGALVSGLELLPWTGTLVLIAPLAGDWVDRFGERMVAAAGLLLQGLGYLWIALVSGTRTSYLALVVPLVMSGAGLSMGGPALQKAVLGAVAPADSGKASGIYNMSRLFGGAVGGRCLGAGLLLPGQRVFGGCFRLRLPGGDAGRRPVIPAGFACRHGHRTREGSDGRQVKA